MYPSWPHPWQNHYQQQRNPDVYVPPQGYGRPIWDPRAYGPPPTSMHSPHSFLVPILTGLIGAAYRPAQYPPLNPMLAADNTPVRFDIKKPPRAEMLASTYYAEPNTLATASGATHIRLICKAFPWSIDIPLRKPVTCEEVWDALYKALQEDIKDSEWGFIVGDAKQQKVIEKAAKKRLEGTTGDKQLKRIDYLGDATVFRGLYKDEEFERVRLLPGENKCPETWVVKFGAS
jgi:hypothetical protein